MGKVVLDITMSLDGFIAGPNDEIDPLHDWIFTGEAGDVTRLTDSGAALLDDASRTAGAIVAGRRTYDVADGWGGNPPIPAPYFVLSHHVPEEAAIAGSRFTFVNDGIQSAVEQARAVAGNKDVVVMGGAKHYFSRIRTGTFSRSTRKSDRRVDRE